MPLQYHIIILVQALWAEIYVDWHHVVISESVDSRSTLVTRSENITAHAQACVCGPVQIDKVCMPCRTPNGTHSATPTIIDAYVMWMVCKVLTSRFLWVRSFLDRSVCSFSSSTDSSLRRSCSCCRKTFTFSASAMIEITDAIA